MEALADQGYGAAQYQIGLDYLAKSGFNIQSGPLNPITQKYFQYMLLAANNPNTPTTSRVSAIMELINAYQNAQGTIKNLKAADYWTSQLDYINTQGCDPFAK